MVPEPPRPARSALTHAPLDDIPQNDRGTLPEPEAGVAVSNAQALASLMATFSADADGSDLAPPASPPPAAAPSSTNGHKPAPNGKPDLEALIATWNGNRGTLPSCRKVPSGGDARKVLLRLWDDADGDLALMGAGFRAASQDEFYQANNYGIVTVARNFAGRWQGIASRKREIDAECDRWRPAE